MNRRPLAPGPAHVTGRAAETKYSVITIAMFESAQCRLINLLYMLLEFATDSP